jgi:hypothetical protein
MKIVYSHPQNFERPAIHPDFFEDNGVRYGIRAKRWQSTLGRLIVAELAVLAA